MSETKISLQPSGPGVMRRLASLDLQRIDAVTRFVAVAGIVFVVVFLLTLTVLNLRETSARLGSLSRSVAVGDAYNSMLVNTAAAVNNLEAFARSGDVKRKIALQESIDGALAASEIVRKYGSDEDRALLSTIEAQYGQQLALALDVLAEAREPEDAVAEIDPFLFSDLAATLSTPTVQRHQEFSSALRSLQIASDTRIRVMLIGSAASLPLLMFLLYLLLRYERKHSVQVLELNALKEAALTDSLTGLGNHRAFQDDLKREMARASRLGQPLSIAMVDIDDFKVVNDTYGHMHGDRVLARLGHLVDLAMGKDLAYRIGGDEFAIIMPDTDEGCANQALQRLRQSARSAIKGVTLSLGLCSNHANERDAASLRDHADLALYEAKHRGKNQIAIYAPGLGHDYDVTAAKMNALREVLRSGEVVMLFQPILGLASNQVLAFEALLRLPKAERLSGPEEAFAIAERMGHSRDLDLLCVATALDSVRSLAGDAKVFINLDPATLMHLEFSAKDFLFMALQRGVDPARVVFEITEKTTVPLPRLVSQIAALRDCGFGVALDDVGSGNSGLELLRLATFDYVKIDRSVVLDATNGGPGRAVIVAIVAFAQQSGAFVIAEGIESDDMLKAIQLDESGLQRFWIKGVQGFLFGRPMSPTTLEGKASWPAA